VLEDHAGVGEVHEHGSPFGPVLSHSLAGLTKAAFEIGGDRHIQIPQAQFLTDIDALLVWSGVDRPD
jgi:hypothetical protein